MNYLCRSKGYLLEPGFGAVSDKKHVDNGGGLIREVIGIRLISSN